MKDSRSKTFCVVPWVQVATNATGNYRVCCNGIPGKNLVYDESNRPMKINKNSVAEVWSSGTYQKIRSQFLNGEKPEMCQRCFREEESDVKSARMSWNERWETSCEDQINPELDIKYIDLRLGNLCNLKCRMCNPYASSKWVDEWNLVSKQAELVPNFSLDDQEGHRLKHIDWPDDSQTWTNLEPILESIEEIYLTGGEPFLSLKQTELLNKLIEQKHAAKIKLKYNTNLTYLPPTLLELWPHFKSVVLNISIDGVGSLDEYIRYPTKWDVVEKNLKELMKLRKEGLPIHLGIHVTVQMYNILRLDEVLDYFENHFGIFPYLNILNHPHCLNIRVLPQSLKKEVTNKLSHWLSKKEVREVASYMNQEDWNIKYFGEFMNYTKTLDHSRNQSLFDTSSEFKNFFVSQ